MKHRMIRIAFSAALLLGALCLGACNTIQGAGKDLQRFGQELEEVLDG